MRTPSRLLLLCGLALLAGRVVGQNIDGQIVVAHPGFEEFRFAESFVYIFELNDYVEVMEDGTFTVPIYDEGRYSLKTYVPGFEPTYRTLFPAENAHVTVPITLQLLSLDPIRAERSVPRYLERLRETIQGEQATGESSEEAAVLNPPLVVPNLPQSTDNEEPRVDLTKFGQFVRGLFNRNRDDEE